MRLRAWNQNHELFSSCSQQDTHGCRTLAGVEEAAYETEGLRRYARKRNRDLGPRFGMASAGSASIQIGIWGAPSDQVQACVASLGSWGLSRAFDPERTKFNAENGAAYFSWLSNHRAPLSAGTSDYEAGGVNEMRARFDEWLITRGKKANPCLAVRTNTLHKVGGVCDSLAGEGIACLSDKWGGYISRLPGQPDSDRIKCNETVDDFLADDVMLKAWHGNVACREIASGTRVWGFLNAFSSEKQLGANISEYASKSWLHVQEESSMRGGPDPFESAEDLAAGTVGEVLTSFLEIGFLRRIGLARDARIQGSKAKMALVAMEEAGLAPGWLSSCPGHGAPGSGGTTGGIVGVASEVGGIGWQTWALGGLAVVAFCVLGVVIARGAGRLSLPASEASASLEPESLLGNGRRPPPPVQASPEPLKPLVSGSADDYATSIAESPRTLSTVPQDAMRFLRCGCCTTVRTDGSKMVGGSANLLMGHGEEPMDKWGPP